MALFVSLAIKSLLVAGATLLLLKLMQKRSASDRSWIAHLGLVALLLLPVGTVALPALEVAGPDFLVAETSGAPAPVAAAPVGSKSAPEVAPSAQPFPAEASQPIVGAVDWAFWAYAVPAAVLVLLTLIAFARLVVLKSRAEVMVDTHWIKALAKAQKRMGFKNGTALLTSDELTSPISWGLMRPVILLNTDATRARGEAEAIIAHELAHVAGLDWAKLMLARLAVALFWFNPLVWLLAREAHQLREEAADDAVLGANIEDTEYANLLVGIARHECRGLLLGAHGVAPARNSLARRVRRVLDAASARAPGGWRWSSAAAFFAAGMIVPVAALQFVNPAIASAEESGRYVAAQTRSAEAHTAPPTIVATAAAVAANAVRVSSEAVPQVVARSIDAATIETRDDGDVVMVSPSGATIRIARADANGRRRTVMTAPDGRSIVYADARGLPGLALAQRDRSRTAIDRAIEYKAVGASPEYVAAMRDAAPNLRLDHDDIVQLKAVGVSPDYVRDLARSGYRGLDADEIVQARALGIDGSYIRGMLAAGYSRLSMDELVEMKAVGVTPADVARFRRAGHGVPSVDDMVQLKAVGVGPEDIPPDEDR
jgi:beta-lactamase regulating signal transducer with metallopeptidase domain